MCWKKVGVVSHLVWEEVAAPSDGACGSGNSGSPLRVRVRWSMILTGGLVVNLAVKRKLSLKAKLQIYQLTYYVSTYCDRLMKESWNS